MEFYLERHDLNCTLIQQCIGLDVSYSYDETFFKGKSYDETNTNQRQFLKKKKNIQVPFGFIV